MVLKSLIIVLLIIFANSIVAQDSIHEADTLKWHQKKLPKSLFAPIALAGVGLSVHKDRGVYSSYDVQRDIQKNYPDFHSHLDDHLRYAPAIATYGLNFAGVRGKNNFVKSSLIYAISITVSKYTYRALKKETNIYRPDSSDQRSMPSGHTTIAFVSATFMHEEFKHKSPWYSIAAYSMATATGAYRMLNNKHYLSDVLIGASIGIATTKLTYLAYPWIEHNLCKCPRPKGTLLIPEVDNKYIGFRLRKSLN